MTWLIVSLVTVGMIVFFLAYRDNQRKRIEQVAWDRLFQILNERSAHEDDDSEDAGDEAQCPDDQVVPVDLPEEP